MNTTLAQAEGGAGVAEAAQIAVVLVLCLAVAFAFAVVFLGSNLLLQAEGLAAPPAQGERRPSREAEGATEGV